MAEIPASLPFAKRASGFRRWFEPRRIGQMSPGGKVVVYGLLALWSAFVLFPFYWLAITSFKLPVDVFDGPSYLPWIDFTPNLHAWADLADFSAKSALSETLTPYRNSVIIAFCSTALCVLVGAMAAYALARIEYKPRFGNILVFVLLMIGAAVAVGVYGVDLWIAGAVAVALFVLLARSVGRYFKRSVGNADILFWMISQRILPPVVAVVPIYMMFQKVGMLDTHLAIILTYTVVNLRSWSG